MQICGSDKEYDFLLSDWKLHAQELLRNQNPVLLGKAFAKLVWCNPKQPHLASVYCKVVKEPGALVLTVPGEDCRLASIAQMKHCILCQLAPASLDDCRSA